MSETIKNYINTRCQYCYYGYLSNILAYDNATEQSLTDDYRSKNYACFYPQRRSKIRTILQAELKENIANDITPVFTYNVFNKPNIDLNVIAKCKLLQLFKNHTIA